MTTNVSLTPELERFARECVESGGYNNVSEVVRSALRDLQERHRRREAFQAMLRDVEAEVERDGVVELEEAMAEIDDIIDAAEREAH